MDRVPIGNLARHLARILASRLAWRRRPSAFLYDEIVRRRVWACADPGAFARPLPRFPGVEGVVLMEDRHPQFFLSFREFAPAAPTGLNRHGPLHHWETQQDLKELVGALQAQGIRVAIGVWNYGGWWPLPPSPWVRAHPELRRVSGSSDLEPFVRIQPDGIAYAEYVGRQYERLRAAFGFDGLMLGDGFCGYGSFMTPDRGADREDTIPRWTEFYRTVASWVHRDGGVLLAYDRMGFSYEEAKRHGADYRALAERRAGRARLPVLSAGVGWILAHPPRGPLRARRLRVQSRLGPKRAAGHRGTGPLHGRTRRLHRTVDRAPRGDAPGSATRSTRWPTDGSSSGRTTSSPGGPVEDADGLGVLAPVPTTAPIG